MAEATAKDLEQDRAIAALRKEVDNLTAAVTGLTTQLQIATDAGEDRLKTAEDKVDALGNVLNARLNKLEQTAQTLQPIEHMVDRIRNLK